MFCKCSGSVAYCEDICRKCHDHIIFLQHRACGPEEGPDSIKDAKATTGAKLGQLLMQGKVHIRTLIPIAALPF